MEWKPPSTPNGVITTYQVCSWILDRDKCIQQSSTTETEETITGLGEYPYHRHVEPVKSVITNYTDPGVPYRVSVTAYTSAGPGPENTLNEIIFTKELSPEQTVTNIIIEWINATTVNISWIPLGIHQARGFPSYRVIIFREGTPSTHRTTTDSSVVIGGLDGNRFYTFIVQPLTGGGPGVQSKPGNPNTIVQIFCDEASKFCHYIILLPSVLVGKRPGDKSKENDDPSTGIGLFIGGVITGVLATLLGCVLVWVLVRKSVTMRVRSVNPQPVEVQHGSCGHCS